MSASELIGKMGKVVIPIKGGTGPGEILISIWGGTESYIAWANEPIMLDDEVMIIEDRGNREVSVIPWSYQLS